ncbi:MAG: hypothetical protein HZA46_12455 [Planctomycetales bacterium]|nr:hypothetical protein [Planctomycetales bacterium]
MADSPDHEDSVSDPIRSTIVSKLCRYAGIVVMLYVVSPGPVQFVYVRGGMEVQVVLDAIYAPLTYLYAHVPAVEHFYDWYFDLFL